MPSVFISPEKLQDAQHWNANSEQLSLSILKDAGVPILGTIVLRPDPQYTFEMRRDEATKGVFVSWH
jgi:hypothetical protein